MCVEPLCSSDDIIIRKKHAQGILYNKPPKAYNYFCLVKRSKYSQAASPESQSQPKAHLSC
jgi:hypothetical protein